MTPARMEAIARDMTPIAKKVLDAVPIGEIWTTTQIYNELRRQGISADMRVVRGCLDRLRGARLITEPNHEAFQRVYVRPRVRLVSPPPIQEISPMPTPAATTTASPPLSALDRLGVLAKKVRSLSDELGDLADDLEEVALSVEEERQKGNGDADKLRQLQHLLRSIGAP